LISHKLWKHFKLPKNKPNPKLFFQTNDKSRKQSSILEENGIYLTNNSDDFMSAICIESISNLTQDLEVQQQNDQTIAFLNIHYLHDLGLELIFFLSENAYSDYSYLSEIDSNSSRASKL